MNDQFKTGVVYREVKSENESKSTNSLKPTGTDETKSTKDVEIDPSNFEKDVVYRLPEDTPYKHKYRKCRCRSSDTYCDYRYRRPKRCVDEMVHQELTTNKQTQYVHISTNQQPTTNNILYLGKQYTVRCKESH